MENEELGMEQSAGHSEELAGTIVLSAGGLHCPLPGVSGGTRHHPGPGQGQWLQSEDSGGRLPVLLREGGHHCESAAPGQRGPIQARDVDEINCISLYSIKGELCL